MHSLDSSESNTRFSISYLRLMIFGSMRGRTLMASAIAYGLIIIVGFQIFIRLDPRGKDLHCSEKNNTYIDLLPAGNNTGGITVNIDF
ncbi:hypothetical protein Glove_54g19 [Diversispora epigaea]|uniref:Uncharacterized protein n=1 Tax=Diversispora epigaea TaxID=1348612 RepID=A0A397JG14_9GLOM|nr:hypothetical protein Glove_54g19 [Diversispora epigaea]